MSRLFRVKHCTLPCHGNYMLRPTELHARHSQYNYLLSLLFCSSFLELALVLFFFYSHVLKATCTSELQQQPELCFGLYSGGMEVNRRREVLASHRLPGQRGHSSPRIPSVVFYRPQFVSQSAHRLLRKCSLSAGSLEVSPHTFDFSSYSNNTGVINQVRTT